MKFFFYGTLKTGHCRNSVLQNQIFVTEAVTSPNYKLYSLGSFPGMVENKEDGKAIKGEIWEIDDECVERLDRIEGHPVLFKRSIIVLADGSEVISYLFQRDISDCSEIGDCWLND